MYGNEEAIGQGIHESIKAGEVRRRDLFIVSKLGNNHHAAEAVLPAVQASLSKLQLDYLDLYHIHWWVACKAGYLLDNTCDHAMRTRPVQQAAQPYSTASLTLRQTVASSMSCVFWSHIDISFSMTVTRCNAIWMYLQCIDAVCSLALSRCFRKLCF